MDGGAVEAPTLAKLLTCQQQAICNSMPIHWQVDSVERGRLAAQTRCSCQAEHILRSFALLINATACSAIAEDATKYSTA